MSAKVKMALFWFWIVVSWLVGGFALVGWYLLAGVIVTVGLVVAGKESCENDGPECIHRWYLIGDLVYGLGLILTASVIAALCFTAPSVIASALLWWKHSRRNRKRLIEHVLGVVREGEGRLEVVPVKADE